LPFADSLKTKPFLLTAHISRPRLHGQQELNGNGFLFVINPNVIENGMSETGQKSIRKSKMRL